MKNSTQSTRSAVHPESGETMTRSQNASVHSIWMRAVLGMVLMISITTSVGCFLPIYSARPERRVQQLLYTSENLRAVVDEWERFWQLDAPSHLTPIRTHGGIL